MELEDERSVDLYNENTNNCMYVHIVILTYMCKSSDLFSIVATVADQIIIFLPSCNPSHRYSIDIKSIPFKNN